jgi:hypothetical protein
MCSLYDDLVVELLWFVDLDLRFLKKMLRLDTIIV